MALLHGSDLDSALDSLAAAAEVRADDLAASIIAYDESELGPSEDAVRAIPRQVFARLGADVDGLAFEGARYFHGTRVLDPGTFLSHGILPLDRILEDVWAALYQLAAEERTAAEWDAFRESLEQGAGGHSGFLYRFRTSNRLHFGPYGSFVREVLLNPESPTHDYLGGPEIVEDIAGCYEAAFGTNLIGRFSQATTPCVVTFDSDKVHPSAANSVFWFAFTMLREGRPGFNANGGDDFGGLVTPERIASVDVCELAGERVYRVVSRLVPGG